MATAPLIGLTFVRNIHGVAPFRDSFPEAASQTFKKGDLVYLSGGYVTVCGADPSLILGIACEDANGDTSAGTHDVTVELLDGNIYETNVYAGTAITAVTTPGTLYGLVAVSNKWYVDLSDTSSTRVNVVKVSEKDTVGDTYGRVEVMFVNKYLQLTGGNI